jgi:Uma2 family endonuclease
MPAATQVELTQGLRLAGLPMPLTLRPPVRLSDEQIMRFSQQNRPYQIERNPEGELEIMSPTGSDGSRWEALVIMELSLWARDHGGVSFSSNGGFTLADGSMRSPDAAWVAESRWNQLTREQRSRYAPICPDFVIEILSSSDSLVRLIEKMESWLANGARLAWMIDPYTATVRIFRPGHAVELLDRPDSVEAHDVVPGFRLTTRMLWDEEI